MQPAKRKPLVAVLDWKTAPASNSGVDLEAKVLGQSVRTKYYLIDTEADFTPEILGADALIVWQNTLITERTLDRLKRCRALIRNGVWDLIPSTSPRRQRAKFPYVMCPPMARRK